MKIEDLKNQMVKISPRSITCKGENGKTKGIVNGVENFKNLRPNIQAEYFGKIKSAGLWGDGESKNIYYQNGKLYYLYDLKQMEMYEKYFIGKPGYEMETENYNRKKQIAENAMKIATVIPCYILK